jgi:hypothetical protein
MDQNSVKYNGTLFEPEIFFLAQCDNLQLFNPVSGEQSAMTRQEVGSLLAFLDIICVVVFVLANIFQHRISAATVDEFKEISLHVSDFSVEVENLPPLAEYKNQHILKAMLWDYFRKVAAAQPQVIEEMKKTQRYESEVVDVFFGHKHLESLDLLSEIKERQKQIKMYEVRALNSGQTFTSAIGRQERKIEKTKRAYWTLKAEEAEKSESIVGAFVIFRSMEGKARILKAFREPSLTQRLCQSKKTDEAPLFMDKYKLRVKSAIDPDLIQWQNLGTSPNVRMVINLINFVFGLCVISLMTYVVVIFNEYQNLLDKSEKVVDRSVTLE